MTAILYVKGDGLYSDKKYIRTHIPERVKITYDEKIFVAKDKSFMYAITGFANGWNDDFMEARIATLISKIEDNKLKIFTSDEIPVIVGDIMIATGHRVYLICSIDKHGEKSPYVAIDITNEDYFAMGSGEYMVEAIMRTLGNPEFAINTACRYCSTCGLGPDGNVGYQSISQLSNKATVSDTFLKNLINVVAAEVNKGEE